MRVSRGPASWWRAYRPLLTPVIVVCLALVLFACYRETKPEPPTPAETQVQVEPRVRIALVEGAEQLTLELSGSWKAVAEAGALVLSGPVAATLRRAPDGVQLEADGAVLSGAELSLTRLPAQGGEDALFELDGRTYRGDLRARALEGGKLRLINEVGVEDYLACVIGHEMPISWSDAALHAQAIAARTYALATLKPGKDYDLFADTRSQVYRGVIAEDARARKLVESTRGMVVTHGGDLVVTYFHSTCGGDTVPASWVFPWVEEDTPPLMGAEKCTCQPSKYYRWTSQVDLRQKPTELVLELPLRSIQLEHWPRGRYVKRVVFTDAGGDVVEVSGWDMRRIFGNAILRNYAFDAELSPDGNTLAFEGRGWGHGVGMCQFGAEGFSKQGWDGKRILEHFYPGATVESLGY